MITPPISWGGQTHVFQAYGNTLWHKWEQPDSNAWNNESVPNAAGVGNISIPEQSPGVTILASGKLSVTVQDAAGRGWFFTQAPGGAWGGNELP